MKRARKNRETKEHICVQSIVNVTMSSSTNNRNGYIGKFMTDAGFTARLGRQVSISEETHERVMKFVSVVGRWQQSIYGRATAFRQTCGSTACSLQSLQ